MAKGKRDGLLIAGGGLAGSLAALAMAKARPEVPILLIEEGGSFGGDRIWSFYDDEIDEDRWVIEPIVPQHWQGYYVAFPGRSRKFKAGYNVISSAALDAAVRERLRPDQYRLGTKVVAVRDDELVLLGGEKIKADGAIDARGAANLSMLDLGWRKYFGREYRFSAPHGVDRPVLMDATVEQAEGYRFVRCLPFSDTLMLVEEVYYSDGPDVDVLAMGARLDAYVARRGWAGGTIEREKSGTSPIPTGGDFGAFWRVGGARVAKIGLRGGFFHPTTGQTVADAAQTAALLTQQREISGPALHDLFEQEAANQWRKRELYRGFNGTLLSAKGEDRRRIFESFYELDPALIARFNAGRTGMLDKMKLAKLPG
jgi:lycopene beta-cyclase